MDSYSLEMATDLAFGTPFSPTPKDKELVRDLLNNKLTLFPHPEWQMPEDPTWAENPFSEPNWVTQLHMLRWLDPLRREAEHGNSEALDKWIAIAGSWIDKNPPGRGKATYAWADFVDAMRAMTLCFALPILTEKRPDSLPKILKSIHQHGTWLANPKNIRSGNHALQQHQGLLVVGAVLENQEWIETALQRSIRMLQESYDSQGVNEEGAPQYHHMNYNWWNLLRRRFKVVLGTTPSDFDRVLKAPIALAHSTRPDGLMELIGDTEEFRTRGIDHPVIDYVSSSGEKGMAPPELVKIFDAGYIFGRSTWGDEHTPFSDASFYSLMFGHQKKIHGHEDGLALTLYTDGEPLLIDAGKYAYDHKDTMRSHLISRMAHNTVVLKGLEYDRDTTVRLEASTVQKNYEAYRLVDEGYPGVSITRDIVVSLNEKLVVVRDSVDSSQDLEFSQWWHLAPNIGHRKDDNKTVFLLRSAKPAWITTASESVSLSLVRGRQNPHQGWYSPKWREVLETRACGLTSASNEGPVVTLIDFSGTSEAPSIVRDESSDVPSFETYHVTRADRTFTVGFGTQIGSFISQNQTADVFARVASDSEPF